MDNTQKFQNALNFAKQNPNHPLATELRKRIETGGYDKEMVSLGYKQPTGIAETGQDIAQIGTGIKQRINERVAKTQAAEQAGKMGEQSAFRTGTQMIGQGAGAVSDVIGEVVKGGIKAVLPQKAETGIKKGLESAVGAVAQTEPVQKLMQNYEALKETNPALARDIDSALGFTTLATDIFGGGIAKQGANVGAKTAKTIGGDIIETVVKKVDDITPNISTPEALKPEQVMQRVARIPKGAQAKFEKNIGESVGSYLVNRGIYGNDEEILTQLYNRFSKSKGEADKAFASLQGTFKPKQVGAMLKEVVEREKSISSPGAISKDLKEMYPLINKYKTDGLTMSEINKIKRTYERNNTIDYLKQNLPDKVAKAKNLDTSVRDWQYKQAEKLGFQNLGEVNKETRAAKELLDSLGKEVQGAAGNNALSLTDAVLVAGGDPTSIGMLLARKTFGSKGLQSKFAKTFAQKPTVGEPKAIIGKAKPGLEEFNASLEKRVPPLSKSQLSEKSLPKVSTELPKKASIPEKTKPTLPKVQNTLESEARKYKSAEDFVNEMRIKDWSKEMGQDEFLKFSNDFREEVRSFNPNIDIEEYLKSLWNKANKK